MLSFDSLIRRGALQKYDGLQFSRAAFDFRGSEPLDKARRPFIVFLGLVAIWDLAGLSVEVLSAYSIYLRVARPWAVELGGWIVFFYFASAYFALFRKEIEQYRWEHYAPEEFFVQLARQQLVQELRKAVGKETFTVSERGSVYRSEGNKLFVKATIQGVPLEKLVLVPGYDCENETYVYEPEPRDYAYYDRALVVLRPAFSHRYITYVLPLHAAAVVTGMKLGPLVRHCADFIVSGQGVWMGSFSATIQTMTIA